MPRYKLTVEYDGTDFVGWQRQINGPSVQAALEAAMHRFCGADLTIRAAGRTDAGVHALGQVVHADIDGAHPPAVVRDAMNFYLRPLPIVVVTAEIAPPGFDARLSAVARAYRYRIVNRVAPAALARDRAWHVATPLNAAAMRRAARCLIAPRLHHLPRQRVPSRRSIGLTRSSSRPAHARSSIIRCARWSAPQACRRGEVAGSRGRALAARDRRRAGPTAPARDLPRRGRLRRRSVIADGGLGSRRRGTI